MRLANKVALVTGAGSGIGRASAVLFSKEGARLSITDIKNQGLQQTADMIRQNGGQVLAIQADVTSSGDVKRMVEQTLDKYGRIDVLFNNAGIAMSPTPLEEVSEELFDRIMAINVKGVFLGCKYAAPLMKKQGGGVIINTSSISGVRPRPNLCAYSASKGAVNLLTKGLAIELAPYHIRVNCINPVATDTPMLADIFGPEQLEAGKKALLTTIPLGRLAQPEDMAQAALYLASDDSSMVTGICLEVDGGRGI